jgi:hypothetical protein
MYGMCIDSSIRNLPKGMKKLIKNIAGASLVDDRIYQAVTGI